AATDLASFARALDGSFLIFVYEPETPRLVIINDRFAAFAFYYRVVDGALWGALSFKQLFDELAAAGRARVAPEAVFEFLSLRRLFGCHTYERDTRFLDSASILSFRPGECEPGVEKYWRPGFERAPQPAKSLAGELAEALAAAVAAHMSDGAPTALMLSGGLDSRAILAAAAYSAEAAASAAKAGPAPPVCVTTCLSRNNEYEVAQEVAAAAGAEHVFIERPRRLYDDVVDDAVFLTGGQQVYNECQFLGYGPRIAPRAEVVFLGLGLDVFFGGLYLPKAPARWLGRPALHYRLKPLGPDLARDFMTGVSYRLKTSDPFSVVRDDWRRRLEEAVRASLEAVIEQGRALGAAGYDMWEYLHLHNFSRHYSFPMAASIRSFADCRLPALSNRVFDLAFRLGARHKVNGEVYRRALNLLNPAVMAVRNANTNMPARQSLFVQSVLKAARFAGSRLVGTGFRPSPSYWDRSWPLPADAIADNPKVKAMVEALPGSERLASLGFLDPDKLRAVLDAHDRGAHDHGVLLNLLLTLDRFLCEPEPGTLS
ncbi:MAG: asparagine synthase-related protein, partial [Kiloniellales bacterium]